LKIIRIHNLLLIGLFALLAACAAGEETSPYPGEVDWDTAVKIIHSGEVASVFQTHSLEITLYLKDGQEIHTVEPAIDAVIHEVDICGDRCSQIMIATE